MRLSFDQRRSAATVERDAAVSPIDRRVVAPADRSLAAGERVGFRWRVLVVLGSAVSHAFAFPPWEQSWLVWLSLVPLFLGLRGMSPRRGFVLGWLWGTAAIWVVAYWVPPALRFYYQQPWWFAIVFCVVGSQILWGTYYAVFAAAACVIQSRSSGLARISLLSGAWVAAELARSRLLTGEPWMLLGYGLVPEQHMIQIADLGGVYLLSFVAAFVNAAIAEAIARGSSGTARPMTMLATAAAAIASVWLYGSWRLSQPFVASGGAEVAVIQGNIPVGSTWRSDLHARGLREYIDASRAAAAARPTDLIVWPESAVTFFLAEEDEFQGQIRQLLSDTGAALVAGGPHADTSNAVVPRYFNSAFHLTASGIEGRYDKAHLLPFGEYFPLKMIEFLRRRFERVRTFSPGDGTTLLETPAGRAAVVICFEAIFPELVRQQMERGAEILLNLTNDVWLGDHAGPLQHASMVRLRAVENRTWVVRATTTGVSAIIDPYGEVVAASGIDVAATLHARIAPLRVDTIYKRHGDVFACACATATVLFLLWTGARRRHEPARRTAAFV